MTRGEVFEELLNYENEYGFNPSDVYAIVSKIYDELEALQAHIKDIERKYHHCEDSNANLTQKINGLDIRVKKILRWGRTQQNYAHKYYNDMKATQCQRMELWMLLDNIDTIEDIAKDSDVLFRNLCRNEYKKRWDIYEPKETT